MGALSITVLFCVIWVLLAAKYTKGNVHVQKGAPRGKGVGDGEWVDDKPHGKGLLKFANGDAFAPGGRVMQSQARDDGRPQLEVVDLITPPRAAPRDDISLDGTTDDPNSSTIRYENGIVYEGPVKNGVPHGKGIFEFTNGNIYCGEFRYGRRHGKGVYKFVSGGVYDGEWKESKMHGKGVYKFASGGVYDGEWREDMQHGRGKMSFASGDVYDGEWKNGTMHGMGKKTYASGRVYDGEWTNDKRHGKGKMSFASGDAFDGEWKDGKRHGKGVYQFPDGSVYDGEWREDMRHGRGKMSFASGDVYDGEWRDGKAHGRGQKTFADGNVYDGEWKDGQIHGRGKMSFPSGDAFEGEWKEGMRHGKGKVKFACGLVLEGQWKEGSYDWMEGKEGRYDWVEGMARGWGRLRLKMAILGRGFNTFPWDGLDWALGGLLSGLLVEKEQLNMFLVPTAAVMGILSWAVMKILLAWASLVSRLFRELFRKLGASAIVVLNEQHMECKICYTAFATDVRNEDTKQLAHPWHMWAFLLPWMHLHLGPSGCSLPSKQWKGSAQD